MTRLSLEIYYESESDRDVADRGREALLRLVRQLAPHISLEVVVLKARTVRRAPTYEDFGAPYHPPSRDDCQTLLITSEDIGWPQGWGWGDLRACVVRRQELERKASQGGDPADLLIHEWLHTLYGMTINGSVVPNVDEAEQHKYHGLPGPDGDDTWHDWYRVVLGG